MWFLATVEIELIVQNFFVKTFLLCHKIAYKFCEHFNKIGRVDFALALGRHHDKMTTYSFINNNNIGALHTDIFI